MPLTVSLSHGVDWLASSLYGACFSAMIDWFPTTVIGISTFIQSYIRMLNSVCSLFLQGFFIFIFHCLFDQQVCDVLWYINLTSFSNLCSVNVFVLITWCSKQIISVGEAAYF